MKVQLKMFWPCDGEGRQEAEELVRQTFAQTHGAKIQHFHEMLLSMSDSGKSCGVIGATWGGERFFLEIYADEPIEKLLSRRICLDVPRRSLAEIGNLVATSIGGGRLMVAAIAVFLAAAGFEWCVFTGTRLVRATLGKFSDEILHLHDAPLSRLSEEARQDWGTYYDHSPQVNAAYLPAFVRFVRHQGFFAEFPEIEDQARQLGQSCREPSR